jgi:hypothetical protein
VYSYLLQDNLEISAFNTLSISILYIIIYNSQAFL